MTGRLLDDRTTDKRPASHLIPKSYRTDYNALEDYCYHRLTVLVLLPSLPSLDPLIELIHHCGASVQVMALAVQLLRCSRSKKRVYILII